MKKILLVCNAGMSTSMLVAKMKKAAQADGVEVSIEAKSLADAKKEIQEANIVLLGPQIRYELENVKKLAGSVPVEAIDMRDYGMHADHHKYRKRKIFLHRGHSESKKG